MTSDVLVPPLGQTVDTLTLVSWYKNEGDAVTEGEPLFAVETDKATLDVEAPASGVLREVRAAPGDQVKVLTAIATIVPASSSTGTGEPSGHPSAAPEESLAPHAKSLAVPDDRRGDSKGRPPTSPQRIFISPRARRLAENTDVPLDRVTPTGPQGAIIERDILAYLEATQDLGSGRPVEADQLGQTGRDGPACPPPPATSAPPGPSTASPVAQRMAEEAGIDWRTLTGSGPRGQVTREDVARAIAARDLVGATLAVAPSPVTSPSIPLSGMRGVIAERMAASHRETAAVTLTTETDATALVALRRQLAADGIAVSYNDLFLAILAKALAEHPRLNASFAGDTIVLNPQIDLGLAVDTERGLLVPVVRGVDRKGLAQLAAETAALVERARAGRCTPDELRGSTFTVTNLGMYGIDAFTPIINLPECAILGVGRISTQPAWVVDHVEPRERIWLSLTFDHRLVDGGPAARFLQRIAQLVEKPYLLIT